MLAGKMIAQTILHRRASAVLRNIKCSNTGPGSARNDP